MRHTLKLVATSGLIRTITVGVSLFAVAFVGLLSTAWWDPQAGTQHLVVAVVNQDEGAVFGSGTIGDEELRLGETVAQKLVTLAKDDGTKLLDWRLIVDRDAAVTGLRDGTNSMVVVIPPNFSTLMMDVVSSVSGANDAALEPTLASMEYLVDGTNPPLDTSLLTGMAQQLVQTVSSNAASELFTRMRGAQADGTQTLATNTDKLKDGSKKLVTGVDRLSSGLASAVNGVDKLSAGAATLNDKAHLLASKLKTMASGTKKLRTGSLKLLDGVQRLDAGLGTAAPGLATAATNSSDLNRSAAAVASNLSKYLTVHPEAASDPHFAAALGAANGTSIGLDRLAAALATARDNIGVAAGGAHQLRMGADALATNSAKLKSGARAAAAGAKKLASGAAQVVDVRRLRLGTRRHGPTRDNRDLPAERRGARGHHATPADPTNARGSSGRSRRRPRFCGNAGLAAPPRPANPPLAGTLTDGADAYAPADQNEPHDREGEECRPARLTRPLWHVGRRRLRADLVGEERDAPREQRDPDRENDRPDDSPPHGGLTVQPGPGQDERGDRGGECQAAEEHPHRDAVAFGSPSSLLTTLAFRELVTRLPAEGGHADRRQDRAARGGDDIGTSRAAGSHRSGHTTCRGLQGRRDLGHGQHEGHSGDDEQPEPDSWLEDQGSLTPAVTPRSASPEDLLAAYPPA